MNIELHKPLQPKRKKTLRLYQNETSKLQHKGLMLYNVSPYQMKIKLIVIAMQ